MKLKLPLRISVETIYILLVGGLGVLLLVLVPPFQSPDEQTHLYRAYQLSQANILGDKLNYGSGAVLPTSLSDTYNIFTPLIFNPDKKVSRAMYSEALHTKLEKNKTSETRFENTAAYSPVTYLPQIVGVGLGRLLSINPLSLLYLARICNLAVWVGLLAYNMRRNRELSLPLFALALIPIVSFQASSASADVFTSAISITFVLEFYRLFRAKAATRADLIILASLTGLLALCKMPYVLLTLLLLLLPAATFARFAYARYIKYCLILGAIVLSLVWFGLAQSAFVNLRGVADSPAQIHYILAHPLHYFSLLFRTYFSIQSDLLYIQFVGQLGWLDTKLPLWSIFAGGAAVITSLLTAPVQTANVIHKRYKLLVLGLLIAIIIAITSSLYLTYTSVGSKVVDGLQGRYFIPLWGLLVLLLAGWLQPRTEHGQRARVLIYCMSGSVAICSTLVLALRYYPL